MTLSKMPDASTSKLMAQPVDIVTNIVIANTTYLKFRIEMKKV